MDEKQAKLAAIVRPLLAWYDENKRDLPWRGTTDPYKVWVSEIMLQQTRVAAALPYYRAWMEELPTVEALAAVPEARLMKLWQGLGYYSRARNLKKAAQVIVNELDSRFPDNYTDLLDLPGVGTYTAGAVASIAFRQRVPAVDGNVLRVAARVADIREDILEPRVRDGFHALVASAVPADRPGEFNQALMDLGATVCLATTAPLCGCCPLKDLCEANCLEIQDQLPVRKKKAPRRVEELTVFLLLRDGRIALRKRPRRGLLAGLWEFPNVLGKLDESAAAQQLSEWGLAPMDWQKKIEAKHIFTHVEWHMTGYLLSADGADGGFIWADREELEALAVPSAFARYLEEARLALEGRE
ncbi:MAG: A/G-specific adenine glycosylase [Oscillospiraceae bacterium]|nr:A/G-specific adenine glycosylase [Oscillospiraceae bacterium]